MKVLDKEEKKIYNTFMKLIKFEKIDCWNVKVPEGWKNIKVAKFDKDNGKM